MIEAAAKGFNLAQDWLHSILPLAENGAQVCHKIVLVWETDALQNIESTRALSQVKNELSNISLCSYKKLHCSSMTHNKRDIKFFLNFVCYCKSTKDRSWVTFYADVIIYFPRLNRAFLALKQNKLSIFCIFNQTRGIHYIYLWIEFIQFQFHGKRG